MSYSLIDENVQPACHGKNAYRRFSKVMTGHRHYLPGNGRFISRDPFLEFSFLSLLKVRILGTSANNSVSVGMNDYSICANDSIDNSEYLGGGILCSCPMTPPDKGHMMWDDQKLVPIPVNNKFCTSDLVGTEESHVHQTTCKGRWLAKLFCMDCSDYICSFKIHFKCEKIVTPVKKKIYYLWVTTGKNDKVKNCP